MNIEQPASGTHFKGHREVEIDGITWLISYAGPLSLSTRQPDGSTLRLAYGNLAGRAILRISLDPRAPGDFRGGGATYLGVFTDTDQIADADVRALVESGLRANASIGATVLAERSPVS